MLKLPVCPHCGSVFYYGNVRRTMWKRTGNCENCKKDFLICGGWGRALFCLTALLVLMGVNFLLMLIPAMNLSCLAAATGLGVAAAYFLLPYTVKYRLK